MLAISVGQPVAVATTDYGALCYLVGIGGARGRINGRPGRDRIVGPQYRAFRSRATCLAALVADRCAVFLAGLAVSGFATEAVAFIREFLNLCFRVRSRLRGGDARLPPAASAEPGDGAQHNDPAPRQHPDLPVFPGAMVSPRVRGRCPVFPGAGRVPARSHGRRRCVTIIADATGKRP